MSPSSIALFSGFNKTAPTPSPGTYPSASSPKLAHLPFLEANFPWDNVKNLFGCIVTLTPPAIAALQFPFNMLSQA